MAGWGFGVGGWAGEKPGALALKGTSIGTIRRSLQEPRFAPAGDAHENATFRQNGCPDDIPGGSAVGDCLYKVTLPSSDNTPPTLRWTIYNYETSETTNITGNGRVSIGLGKHVRVIVIAEDPQGIDKISLSVSGTHTCQSGDAVKIGQFSGGTHKQVLNPDSNHQVLTRIFLLRDVALNQVCQSGYVYESGTAWVKGVGENYSGGVTMQRLLSPARSDLRKQRENERIAVINCDAMNRLKTGSIATEAY